MAALTANWVKESTATTGTGTINLGGAETGFIAFSDTFSTADTVHYIIEDGNNKEYGIGTLTTGTPWTLARTTVLETLVSGTFDNTSPAAINLSGSAIVGVGPIAYPPGSIVGFAETTDTSYHSLTGVIPFDDTIPQSTEGDELFTVTYTPKYADSKLRVTYNIGMLFSATTNRAVVTALFRDSATDADAVAVNYDNNSIVSNGVSVEYVYDANSTSSTTFKVRGGSQSSSEYNVGGSELTSYFSTATRNFIRVEEIRQ